MSLLSKKEKMNTQYICELYFDKEKSDQQKLMKLSLQSLGFIPNIMSIYVSMDEMYEEVFYNEDLLFSILSNGEDPGITIREDVYDEEKNSFWFKFGSKEGKFVSLSWSNTNLDFLLSEKIELFLKMDGFAAGYVFDNKDIWEQSREAKEKGKLDYNSYPGQYRYVCGMQFMAAPLMWFGKTFFEVINKEKLLKFGQSKELSSGVVEMKLFNIYESPQKIENRIAQRNFWSFFELDKVVAKFEKDNSIDAVQSLNDFIAKMKSKRKR